VRIFWDTAQWIIDDNVDALAKSFFASFEGEIHEVCYSICERLSDGLKSYKRALYIAEKALELCPNDGYLIYMTARIHYFLGHGSLFNFPVSAIFCINYI